MDVIERNTSTPSPSKNGPNGAPTGSTPILMANTSTDPAPHSTFIVIPISYPTSLPNKTSLVRPPPFLFPSLFLFVHTEFTTTNPPSPQTPEPYTGASGGVGI